MFLFAYLGAVPCVASKLAWPVRLLMLPPNSFDQVWDLFSLHPDGIGVVNSQRYPKVDGWLPAGRGCRSKMR
jgi:hypothetical protein